MELIRKNASKIWSSCLLLATATIAILGLAGVATHHVALRCWVSNTVPIKELTSWMLLWNAVIGSLLIRPDRRMFHVPVGLLVVATAIMLYGLIDHILHLENLASYDPKASYYSSLAMAAGSAFLALRAGCALIFRSHVSATCCSVAVAAIGICALLGYALDVPAMYFFIPGYVTALAIPTSVAFVLLGLLPIPDAAV